MMMNCFLITISPRNKINQPQRVQREYELCNRRDGIYG